MLPVFAIMNNAIETFTHNYGWGCVFFFLLYRDLGVGPAATGVVARTSEGVPRAFPHLPNWLRYLLFREARPPFALEPWQVEAACLGLDSVFRSMCGV